MLEVPLRDEEMWMKRVLLYMVTLMVAVQMQAAGNFITKSEYAKLLYRNPRGIGCDTCHGEHGEGKVIARYREKGVLKELRAPRIDNLSPSAFHDALTHGGRLMPEYYLTDMEIAYLYYYITDLKENDEH